MDSGGSPHSKTSISFKAPQVVLDMTDKKIDFLIDKGATYPVLIPHAELLSFKSCIVMDVEGKSRIIILLGLSLANLSSS